MFKDDRLISVLSGVLLMAALGMIVQRSDVMMDFLEGPRTAPVADRFELAAGERHLLDVLANDKAVPEDARPVAVVGPGCGTVRTSGRRLLYVGEGCSGAQTLSYRISGDNAAPAATVEIALRSADPEVPRREPEPVAATEPSVPRPDLSGSGLPGMTARGPDAPVPSEGGDAAGTAAALGIEGSDAAPARAPASEPGALAAVDAAPDRVEAPESVNAPRTGRAPSAMADTSARDSRVATPAPAPAVTDETVPDGLFGTTDRAFTQATPDPSRPAPAVPLGNLLAYAPAPTPPAGGVAEREAEPEMRLRRIANMPEGFAASPQGLSAPLIAAAQDRPARSLSLVRVDRSLETARTPSGPEESDAGGGFDGQIPRANPVRISRDQSARIALADPSAGLGDVRDLGQTGSLGPVTVGRPTGLSAPSGRDASILEMQEDAEAQTAETAELAALTSPLPRRRGAEDEAETNAAGTDAAPPADGAGESTRVAALPEATAVCAAEPAMTVDPRPAGRTTLVVVSPCHAGSIAELRYSDLRLAIPLDGAGRGEVEVLGFDSRADAVLWFRDGREIGFSIPFVGMRNLTRVALVWDAPVVLDLHAFEFGAGTGGEGHVHPGNRRSFEEIRRGGGGFLTTYSSINGIGQNMQVYSYWKRRSNTAGVVDLAVDYASRSHERRPDTCGGGPYAAPAFVVLRSENGEMDRALNRRLSAMGCGQVSGRRVLIEAAVDDVIIRGR